MSEFDPSMSLWLAVVVVVKGVVGSIARAFPSSILLEQDSSMQ